MVLPSNLSLCHLLFSWILLSVVLLVAGQEGSSTESTPIQELVVDALSSKDEELVVDKGSNFTLTCRSIYPVNWTYPHYKTNDDEERSIPEIYLGVENGLYIAKLTMYYAYFMDTGYFTCHQQNADSLVAQVYVYVRDQDNFLAINNTMTVYTKQEGDTVEIPCRPTDPSLTVELIKDSVIFPDVDYDPRKGFSFVVKGIGETGIYECVVEGGSPIFFYYLHVVFQKKTYSIEKPHISVSHKIAAVNTNVSLTCSIHHNLDVTVVLDWVLPDPRLNKSNHIHSKKLMKKVNEQYYYTEVTLDIYNVNKEDEGEYICKVVDQSNNQNSNKTTLRVTDHSVLELIPAKTEYSVHPGVAKEELVVNIESSPEVKYKQWYDYEDQLIITKANSKYTVTDNQFMSKLTIVRPNIRDSGTYRLEVDNGVNKSSVLIPVKVNGILEVIVNKGETEKFYLTNNEHIIDCEVFGHPRPNITWVSIPCPNYPNCLDRQEPVPLAMYEKHNNEELPLHKPLKSSIRVPKNYKTAKFFCVANNLYTQDKYPRNYTYFLATDVEEGFNIVHPELVVETDNVTLSCGASKYKYTSDFRWFLEKDGQQSELLDANMWNEESALSYWKHLNIPDVSKDNAAIYRCQATHKEANIEKTQIYNMVVESLLEPQLSRGSSSAEWNGTTGQKVTFHCLVDGMPPPSVIWYKQTEMGEKELEGGKFKLRDGNESLTITVGLEDDGKFVCRAANKAGKAALEFQVIVTDKPNRLLFLLGIYVLPFAIMVIVIVIAFYFWRVYKLRKEIKELKDAGLLHFEEGNVESLNPDLDVGDQADLLPYDRKKWEFPRDKLKLGKTLGFGAFGVVMKAEAYELLESGVATTVAVKMVKRNSDVRKIRALASELKIMIHLGKHLNVVNVLGACTGDLNKRELLVLVEYCQYGNLHNYLKNHRGAFINQVNSSTGTFDPSVIQPVTPRSPSGNFPGSPFGPLHSNGNTSMRTSAAFSHNTDTTLIHSDMSSQSRTGAGDVAVHTSPVGEDGYLISRDHEWRNKDRGDYKDGLDSVCTQDLICWGFQIARGMEYLASRKVLHGDLAARNVLLAEDNIVKICDFGLSKSMYTDVNYHKKGDDPLPVKWMALESIQDRVFSTQSDVWAYGITLWELFSLACEPYPGMEWGEKLFTKLTEGYRMEQPKYSTKQVYQVMVDCWHVNPHSRPTFTELTERMGGMLEDTVRTHYVDLNDPFLEENSEFLAQRDYLSMLRSPTYTNWSSNNYSIMKPVLRDNEEAMELTPMLGNIAAAPHPQSEDSSDGSPTITKPTGNNYVNVAHVLSFSNPNYHNLGRPKQSPYINMPDSADES